MRPQLKNQNLCDLQTQRIVWTTTTFTGIYKNNLKKYIANMENENAYANHGIIIMIAYVNGVKLYRVYKEGNIRAEVTEESEAKRIADLLKYEK
jgi:hypothetical protein